MHPHALYIHAHMHANKQALPSMDSQTCSHFQHMQLMPSKHANKSTSKHAHNHMQHMYPHVSHACSCMHISRACKQACKQTSLYVYIMQQACLAAKHVQKTKNDPCMQAACMHQYSMTSIQTMHACTFAQQPCLHLPRPTMQDLQQNM